MSFICWMAHWKSNISGYYCAPGLCGPYDGIVFRPTGVNAIIHLWSWPLRIPLMSVIWQSSWFDVNRFQYTDLWSTVCCGHRSYMILPLASSDGSRQYVDTAGVVPHVVLCNRSCCNLSILDTNRVVSKLSIVSCEYTSSCHLAAELNGYKPWATNCTLPK